MKLRPLLAILLMTGVSPSFAETTVPFDPAAHLQARSDRYDVIWSGISLGKGTIALEPDGGNCYRYSSTTRPIALVRWTYGSPREESEFCLDQQGQVLPKHFEYINDKRQSDSFRLDFDWQAGTVKTLKDGEMTVRELPDIGYDRFVIREAVRLWVIRHVEGLAPAEQSFTLVDDRHSKSYRFAVIGSEKISTPGGDFDALRVDRVDDPKREAHYWLAPTKDYVPVMIEQYKKDKLELRMVLLP